MPLTDYDMLTAAQSSTKLGGLQDLVLEVLRLVTLPLFPRNLLQSLVLTKK